MSKRHAFDQVVILKTTTSGRRSDELWSEFKGVCKELGFDIRLTGGVYLTHEINGTSEDFETILELING